MGYLFLTLVTAVVADVRLAVAEVDVALEEDVVPRVDGSLTEGEEDVELVVESDCFKSVISSCTCFASDALFCTSESRVLSVGCELVIDRTVASIFLSRVLTLSISMASRVCCWIYA